MYEQNEKWTEYYRELDPGKRKELLEDLCQTEADDGANPYRRFLYEIRYTDPKDPEKEVDRFLFQCVNIAQMYRTSRFFVGRTRKELQKILEDLGFTKASDYKEAGEKALYWEIRNAAARYFQSCRGSEYRRILGILSASEASRMGQMTMDAWQMSRGAAARLGMEEELDLWCRAIIDEHAVQYDDAERKFREIEAERSK